MNMSSLRLSILNSKKNAKKCGFPLLLIVLLFESLHANKPNDISAERLPNEDCRELDMCRIINSTDVENNARKGGGPNPC